MGWALDVGLGSKRKSGDETATSELPLKADITRTSREVRKVPRTEVRQNVIS